MAKLANQAAVVFFVASFALIQASAQTKTKFIANPGAQFGGTLVFDTKGNLFGTTNLGGVGAGSVYKLVPQSNGSWEQIILDDMDLAFPNEGVTLDSKGNVYGADSAGPPPNYYIQGSIFELSPDGTGGWVKTVLYYFPSFDQPGGPNGDLYRDAQGNIFGTTSGNGNTFGPDVIFELQKNGSGYKYVQLYTFCPDQVTCPDGNIPKDGLTADASGNFYGTAVYGGEFNAGVIYKLAKSQSGWTYSVLHSFSGPDGNGPNGLLALDKAGNLYGTTQWGGTAGMGNVFKLSASGTLTNLHSFSGTDGELPEGSVILNPKGILFGTTLLGGMNNAGTVFALVPQGSGQYGQKTLVDFSTNFQNENGPLSGLVMDSLGNLYGNTGLGEDFEIAP